MSQRDAGDQLVQSQATLSNQAISHALDQALGCLKSSFRSRDGHAGWYHYLDDPSPGVTASAVGLFCYHLTGAEFERTDEVVRYLASQQSTGPGESNGGWSVRTTTGFPIVEATAWAVRSLSTRGSGLLRSVDALKRGAQYLERNQNTDFGWGSYLGQPSRVFHTALCMLALQECGGSTSIIENGQKWLIGAQSSAEPAWGPLPGTEPTLLHTSFALLALLNVRGALSANSVRDIADWIFERIEPGQNVEKVTTVEEFDIPYPDDNRILVFQNSLPHFALPVAITALLAAGVDPLHPKLFAAVNKIIDAQRPSGAWELPRSPLRDSIWAIWPFVAALAAMKSALFPATSSQASLLFPGCAIIQGEDDPRKLTTTLLVRNVVFEWVRRSKVPLALSLIASATVIIPTALVLTDRLTGVEFVAALVLPALLLLFQLVWSVRAKARRGAAE